MKIKTKLAALALAFIAAAPSLHAQIIVPNADGSDGALNLTSGTSAINLALAGTGSWVNTSASPGNGTYDPTNWAVVFKYTSVNISANATLTFSNHPTHAPVVWLVNGNVTINGNLNLDGQAATADPLNLVEPGPGGFRGGGSPLYLDGPGFGPGGAFRDHAGYADYRAYGNPQIFPLIGGSGGGGASGWNGGGGGGAILIAATGTITVNGVCHANGGNNLGESTWGSGGAIRLVANQIAGNGALTATAVHPGRIRLEANSVSPAITNNPVTVGVSPGNPAVIFPGTTNPVATVTILSVAGQSAPADPKAIMTENTAADDLTLVTTNNVTILLQTQNFPTTGTVNVFIKPRNGNLGQTTLTASLVNGNTNSALWSVSTILPYPMHSVIQARATY